MEEGSFTTLGEMQRWLQSELMTLGADSPDVEARYLSASVAGLEPGKLLLHRERLLSMSEKQNATALLERRRLGEPLAYLIGEAEFYGNRFKVTPDVLIPRSDTEVLVEQCIGVLKDAASPQILELGTGSGCIVVSLLRALTSAGKSPSAHAVELSPLALQVARDNADLLGVKERCIFHEGDWFEGLPTSLQKSFDLLVSNPPYVPDAEPLDESVHGFEPHAALFGGKDGTDCVRHILSHAPRWVKPGGWVGLEFGEGQDARVRKHAEELGYSNISIYQDYAGIKRGIIAQPPED